MSKDTKGGRAGGEGGASGGGLYEAALRRLAAAAGGKVPPARASASVVPWRRGGAAGTGGIEVFWVKRAEALQFMGGWHAFPGGGLARTDAAIAVVGVPAAAESGSAPRREGRAGVPAGGGGEPDLAPGIAACAIRELFEETGVLLARRDRSEVPGGAEEGRPASGGTSAMAAPGTAAAAAAELAALAAARQELLAGRPFADVLAALGATPDATRLVFAGRWTTPPFAPLRFDNRFFLLEWPPDEAVQPAVVPGELEVGGWIDARQAWEQWWRGEILAAPPILHVLRVLHEEGPEAGLARLRDAAESWLGPIRRVELRPGVIVFPLATHTLPPAATTNAYLLGHGQAVLVDPGSRDPDENERLAAALAAAAREGRRLTAIWLTHHHPDHVGGAAWLRGRLGVPVLAHRLTAERLAGSPGAERAVPIDGELHDGQRVVLAGDPPLTIRVVHTPGHARGHVCFLVEGQRSLLAGDMVAGIGTIVIDPPEGDMDDYLASLDKLLALAPETLFPGHGPAIKDAAGKLREYVAHRLWREQRILAAWTAGRRRPAEMLPAVYDDVPKEAYPIAERQLLAHLARLERAGKLEA
jgi:ribonuclease/clavin/mitogillin